MKVIIILFIVCCVLMVILENLGEWKENKRIRDEFDRKRAIAKERDDNDCANGKHICAGIGSCLNCGAIIPESQKHYCKCLHRGVVPFEGHKICDNCSNLRCMKY